MRSELKDLLDQKIVICLGSGGVGKTTLSAALGFIAAKIGKKVLVLTIDPSQRLMTTLGFDKEKAIQSVKHPSFKGSLDAALLNHQEIFYNLLKRSKLSPESVEKVMKNKLFEQMTTSLSGSQDFTALEGLLSYSKENKYDLIILDTPPAHHSVSFLRSPEKFSKLFSSEVFDWVFPKASKGGFVKSFFRVGSAQVIKALEKITGSYFVSELLDFLKNIYVWRESLEQRILDIHDLLHSQTTRYVLVTSYDARKLTEGQQLIHELKKEGFLLNQVILNRTLPDFATDKKDPSAISKIKKYHNQMRENLKQFTLEQKNKIHLLEVPEILKPISNVEDIESLAQLLIKVDA